MKLKCKRLGSLLLSLCLLLTMLPAQVAAAVDDTITDDRGLEYEVLTEDSAAGTGTAMLTGYDSMSGSPTGNLTVAEAVYYDGINYRVTGIGDYAFSYSSGITGVTIPASVENISGTAFSNCSNLEAFTVDGANTCFSAEDGILYDKAQTTLIKYPLRKAFEPSFSFPATVEKIGPYAFAYRDDVTAVNIPASLEKISPDAFHQCRNLSAFTVDSGNGSFSAEDGILYDKAQTTLIKYPLGKAFESSFSFPATVEKIGPYAFAYRDDITDIVIPGSVEAIGDRAFAQCTSLESVTIGSSVESIGDRAFDQCTSLESVVFEAGSSLKAIGEAAFGECTKLDDMTLPDTLESIGADAFGYTALESVNIGASVNTIGKDALYACTKLTTITVEQSNSNFMSEAGVLYDKAQAALIRYPAMKPGSSFSIPASVETIGEGAFYACKNIEAVTIPASVNTIGASAFYWASGLKEISFLGAVPPSSISTGSTFARTALTEIYVPAGSVAAYKAALSGILDTAMIAELDNGITGDFTDANFLAAVREKLGKGAGDPIYAGDVSAISTLNVSFKGIESLDGIEHFVGLTSLDCSYNKLTDLDTSNLTKLSFLDCSYNRLETLDMSNSTGLATLYCQHNRLTSLNLSGNPKLRNIQVINCSYNRLSGLSLPESLTNFKTFIGSHNWMTSDSDVTGLPAVLPEVRILSPQDPVGFCSVLDITGLPSSAAAEEPLTLSGTIFPGDAAAGKTISFSIFDRGTTGAAIENGILTAIRPGTVRVEASVSGGTSPSEAYTKSFDINVTATDITGDFTDPGFLEAVRSELGKYDPQARVYLSEVSQITELDVSNRGINSLAGIEHFIGLTTLYCSNNQLTSLDVSGLTGLTTLYCSNNQLASLDVTGLTGLTTLSCSNNQLASLDVSGLTGLTTLYCYSNQLTSLDVTGLTGLTTLYCFDNYMASEAVVVGHENVENFNFYPQKSAGSYTVTVNYGTGGGSYTQGQTVTITAASAPDGQRFAEWSITPAVSFTEGTDKYSATAKFTMPGSAVTATALYGPLPASEYAVNVLNDGNGSASANVFSAKAGAEITLTVSPNSGYRFKEWQVISGVITVTDNKFTMPAASVTVKAIFEQLPASAYTVTVNGSYASVSGAGSYVQNAAVSINAGSRSGYTFSGWTSTDGVVFANAGSASTTFIMPAKNVSVTANWSYNSGGDDKGDKDSSGGGSSAGSGSSTPASSSTGGTAPAVGVSGSTASTTAAVSAGQDGKASASVTQSQISEAVAQAKVAAANTGTAPQVEINVPASGASTVATSIPGDAVRQLAGGGIGSVKITTPIASVTFDAKALASISAAASGDVTVSVARVDAPSLSREAAQMVGSRPVFDFSVTSGGQTISRFGGQVTVSVPYTPAPGEDPNAIVIYYISDNGTLEMMPDCRYDAATGTVVFNTDHFSHYAIGYNKVSFKDVPQGAWYAGAVSFLAARDIIGGTGDGLFGPDAKLTRGQFAVMLLKAYGISSDKDSRDNFSDAGDTYYTGYLAAAKRLGISEGTGGNRFEPDKTITRQEMFTLLYKALKAIDRVPAPSGQPAGFSDSGSMASWAKEAIDKLSAAGAVSGNGGLLSPNSTATRGEMAQLLYKLLLQQ